MIAVGPGSPRVNAQLTALQPLCGELLRRASAEAAHRRDLAERDGRQQLAAAQAAAEATIAAARAHGTDEALAAMRSRRAKARADARRTVLSAQRDAFDQLRAMVRADAGELLADPTMRAELLTSIEERLGTDAIIADAPTGGVIAESANGFCRIDASANTLVDGALADMNLEWLWVPQS